MGKLAEPDLDTVLDHLVSSNADVRRAAARVLGTLGPSAAKGAVEHLSPQEVVALLEDDFPEVRAMAAAALGSMKAHQFATELRRCIPDSDPSVTIAALGAVTKLGEDGQALAADVVSCLIDPSAGVRAAAVHALTAAGTAADRHGEAVASLLADPDIGVRMAAVDFFAAMGHSSAQCADLAAKGLATSDSGIQAACATALGHMQAGKHAAAVAILLDTTSDADRSSALWAAGVQAKAPVLLRRPRCAAAVALGMMGEEGAAFAENVAALLDDPEAHPDTVASALRALGLMGMEAHEEKLRAFLEERVPGLRAAACFALGELAKRSENSASLDSVAMLLTDPHPHVREAAAVAVGKMKVEGPRYLDDIARLFSDKAGMVQAAAVRAAGSLGQRGQLYLTRVARVAFEGAPVGRLAAIEVLGDAAEEQGGVFAEDLAELLSDPSPEIRVAVLRSLAKMGRDAKPVLGRISEARADALEDVRTAADECLVAVGV